MYMHSKLITPAIQLHEEILPEVYRMLWIASRARKALSYGTSHILFHVSPTIILT